MELSEIFRIVNLVVAGLAVLGGLMHFFFPVGFTSIIVGSYMVVFGLAIALLEFQIPPQVSRFASFLFSFVGRGAFYIFIGSLIVAEKVITKISGTVVGVIGIAYVALEFVPSIEPPSNMREAEIAGWGAEQV